MFVAIIVVCTKSTCVYDSIDVLRAMKTLEILPEFVLHCSLSEVPANESKISEVQDSPSKRFWYYWFQRRYYSIIVKLLVLASRCCQTTIF